MDFGFTREQAELRDHVRDLAEKKLRPIADRVDAVDEYSPEVIGLLAQEGLFEYAVPREFGGKGISSINACIIREELSRVCTQADVSFTMCLFATQALSEFGTGEQKRRYLSAIARGEKMGTASMTEPGAGSDLSAMATTAALQGDHYVLNGTKNFCTMGAAAEACILLATTDPALGSKGLTAFIVDCKNKQPGLKTEVMRLLSPHPCYKITLDNHRVPAGNVVGQPGEGMKVILSILGRLRATVGAAAVGMAVSAYEAALEYVRNRRAFKRSLLEFQATQLKLADMLTAIDASRLLALRAAWTRDREDSEESVKQASMAKLFGTEAAQRVIDEALQLFGGYGVVKGNRVEYLYRNIRALRVYEGTSEIQRLTITRAATGGVKK